MTLIHKTWLDLKPNEDINGNPECFEDYYLRIQNSEEYDNIPEEVFKQWIHPHHKNWKTLINYSWINYEFVEFELVEWSYEKLIDIYVLKRFRPYTESRGSFDNLVDFCCKKEDVLYWRDHGTWKTPPVVLDVRSLNKYCPKEKELHPPFQLVEGHSRLGYLCSMNRIDKKGSYKIAEKHKVYLMKNARMHNNGS